MSELLKWERATESLLLPLVVSIRNTGMISAGKKKKKHKEYLGCSCNSRGKGKRKRSLQSTGWAPSLWACPARIPEPAKGRWEPVLQQGRAGPQQPQPALCRLSINSTTKDPIIAFFTCTTHFNGVEIEFQLDNA